MSTGTERCELTEIPVSQCPCEHCWPDPVAGAAVGPDEIVHHLKSCGYVDHDDGRVPMFTTSTPSVVAEWTPAHRLVSALLAKYDIRYKS